MDIQFNLRERTVIIAGPFSSTIQNLVFGLTRMGADVALLDKDAAQATKFCQNVTDQREVNDKQGRAMALPCDLSNPANIKDAVGKVAQTFGGIDIYVDAFLDNQKSTFSLEGELSDFDSQILNNLKIPLMMTQNIVSYLRSRKKGRIIYLLNQSVLNADPQDVLTVATRSGLIQYAKSLSKLAKDFNLTVNVLSLGLTEEYVLGHFPECKSIKEAVEKLKLIDPSIRISEPEKIANSVIYLASQFGNGLTGQVLTV
jgi:2-hydroxycyclohexanecarboxyl-CoA dehydrogenase